MSKWIACGSFVDPKRAREFIRFTSKLDYETEGEAEREAQEWREGGREYKYIWVEQTR